MLAFAHAASAVPLSAVTTTSQLDLSADASDAASLVVNASAPPASLLASRAAATTAVAIGASCGAWCAKHSSLWSRKCAWREGEANGEVQCSGCPECLDLQRRNQSDSTDTTATPQRPSSQQQQKPSVHLPSLLLVMADGFRASSLSSGRGDGTRRHDAMARTPNLDALRADRRSVAFLHAYAAEASCAPSRASLLTGRSVRSHNLTRNTDALSPAVLAEGTLASALRSQGYATAHVGKLHVTGMPVDDNPDSPLAATMVAAGFEEWWIGPLGGVEVLSHGMAASASLDAGAAGADVAADGAPAPVVLAADWQVNPWVGRPWEIAHGTRGAGGGVSGGGGSIGGTDERLTVPAGAYQPTHLTGIALGWLRIQRRRSAAASEAQGGGSEQGQQRPWFLTVSYTPPHAPFIGPSGAGGTGAAVPLVARSSQQLAGNRQQGGRKETNDGEGTSDTGPGCCLFPGTDVTMAAGSMPGYFASVAAIDAEFGRLLAAVDHADAEGSGGGDGSGGGAGSTPPANAEEQAVASLAARPSASASTSSPLILSTREPSPLVVFTSDHGYLLGEHGLVGKGKLWEEAIRVPLLLRLPVTTMTTSTRGGAGGAPGGGAGAGGLSGGFGGEGGFPAVREVRAAFSLIDLAPTLLGLLLGGTGASASDSSRRDAGSSMADGTARSGAAASSFREAPSAAALLLPKADGADLSAGLRHGAGVSGRAAMAIDEERSVAVGCGVARRPALGCGVVSREWKLVQQFGLDDDASSATISGGFGDDDAGSGSTDGSTSAGGDDGSGGGGSADDAPVARPVAALVSAARAPVLFHLGIDPFEADGAREASQAPAAIRRAFEAARSWGQLRRK